MADKEIIIRPMIKKELAALCECSEHMLKKELQALEQKVGADQLGKWRGRITLSKAQIRLFLSHIDIIPEKFNP